MSTTTSSSGKTQLEEKDVACGLTSSVSFCSISPLAITSAVAWPTVSRDRACSIS